MRKQILVLLSVIAVLLPVSVSAHGMTDDFGDLKTGPELMSYIENTALGDELHEDMEDMMVKMMSGQLTESEAQRMISLMDQYPGPYSMMMNRLGSSNFSHGWGFMPWGGMMGGDFWPLFMWLASLVWLAVGVLLVIWLIRRALRISK